MQADLDRYPATGRFLMGRLRDALSEDEKQTVEALIERVDEYRDGEVIIRRGELCNQSKMLIDGFVLRTIQSGDRRMVVGIQVPGDYIDLHGFALKRLDHDIVAIGPVRVGSTSHERIRQLMVDNAHLARLLWFSTLLDAAIHREWIMKLQQLRASRRAAHVFCEIHKRLEFVGLAQEGQIVTPLIQQDLADMCGTTAIHMNRALGQLRKDGLADFRRGTILVPDRSALERYATFEPTYLYGEGVLGMRGELSLS